MLEKMAEKQEKRKILTQSRYGLTKQTVITHGVQGLQPERALPTADWKVSAHSRQPPALLSRWRVSWGWLVPDSQLPPAHTPATVGYFQTQGPPLFLQKSWPNSKWSFARSNYKYFSEMTSSKYFILSVYLFDLLLYVLFGNSVDECIWERAALPLSALPAPSHWFSFPTPYPLLNPLNLVL